MPQIISPTLYVYLSGLVFCASLISLSGIQSSDNDALIDQRSPGRFSESTSKNSLGDRAASFMLSGEKDSLAEFASKVAEADREELYEIMKSLYPLFRDDPEKGLLFLKELTSLIAEKSPSNALDLAYGFLGFPGVQNIERGLVYQWSQNDLEGIFNHFSKAGDTANTHHLSIACSIIQNEKIDEFPQWLEWVDSIPADETLGDEQDREFILGEIAGKLAHHATEESLFQVTEFMARHAKNSKVVAYLAAMAPMYVLGSPDEGMAWLNSLDTNPEDRGMIFGSALSALSKAKPEEAARILSADYFIEKYYKETSGSADLGEKRHSQESFYDDMLETYLYSTVRGDPQTAYENAEAFFDSKRKKELQEIAENLMRPAQ